MGHEVEDVRVSNVSIRQRGGIRRADLKRIDEALRDEKAAEYPEATMWGPLPAKGFYVRHARNVHFENVEIYDEEQDDRPEIVKENDD